MDEQELSEINFNVPYVLITLFLVIAFVQCGYSIYETEELHHAHMAHIAL